MKLNNKKINLQRDHQNAIGREAIRHHVTVEDIRMRANPDRGDDIKHEERKPIQNMGSPSEKFYTNPKRKNNLDDDKRPRSKHPRHNGDGPLLGLEAAPPVVDSPRPEPSRDDVERHYQRTICRLLHVDENWSTSLSLHQLRVYARAYNLQFGHQKWYHVDIPSFYGVGPRLLGSVAPGEIDHFAQAIPGFYGLAVDRGDLTADGIVTKVQGHHFDIEGNQFLNQALGTIANPFGVHDRPDSWRVTVDC
jgi:hypothetical protein